MQMYLKDTRRCSGQPNLTEQKSLIVSDDGQAFNGSHNPIPNSVTQSNLLKCKYYFTQRISAVRGISAFDQFIELSIIERGPNYSL